MQAWRAMEQAADMGLARSLGLCNVPDVVSLSRIFAQARVKPRWLQNGFWARTGYDFELRQFCRLAGIGYQGYRLIPFPAAAPLASVASARGISISQAWLAAARWRAAA